MSRPATELALPLRHITLAAKAWGDPTLPPMLALHGWLDNAASFDGIAPLLESHHVVAIDLAGHGRSGWRDAAAWDYWLDNLDDINQLFQHFGWDRADLLGHSLGGTLASTYAAAFPERVRRLILIEAFGPLSLAIDQTVAQLRKGLVERASLSAPVLRVFPDVEHAARARMLANGLSNAAATTLVERGLVAVDDESSRGYRWSSDPRLLMPSLQRYSEEQALAILEAISAPTLLVWADPAHPYARGAAMQARIDRVADLQIQRLAGNHHLHLESPQPVAATINAFLDRCAA